MVYKNDGLYLITERTNLASHLEFSCFHHSYGYDSSTKIQHRFACLAILILSAIPSRIMRAKEPLIKGVFLEGRLRRIGTNRNLSENF